MGKPKMEIVGVSECGKEIVGGDFIFKMLDTHGLPLSICKMALQQNNAGFDVVGFCEAAHRSGHYSKQKITSILLEDISEKWEPEHYRLTQLAIEKVYGA